MATINPLNVFKGPDSLKKYFNPDEQPPLPLIELPEKLNPFRQDGVRIYVKLLTTLPAQNVKALPALNMLLNDPSAQNKSIVEVSSGSTVTSLGVTARVLYNNDDTTAIVPNKTSLDRLRDLQFFGIKVQLYGGPNYSDPTDSRGIVDWARRLGRGNSNIVNLGQYDNEHNWKSHSRWTGPQILKQLPEINIFCMGMGSTGCVTGTGMYLKSQKPSVKVLGVCNKETDLVPGPRERPMHETSPFPWKDFVDFTESVGSIESYRLSMKLSREGLIAGPSTGMALQGLFDFLQKEKDNEGLKKYADQSTGDISCAFICCDLPQKHLETYFKKLSPKEFPPLINEELLTIDQNGYSFRWEINPRETNRQKAEIFDHINQLVLSNGAGVIPNGHMDYNHSIKLTIRILDLRSSIDFDTYHIKGAHNSPLPNLTPETRSPLNFDEIKTLVDQWKELNSMIGGSEIMEWICVDSPLLILCYDGDTSRVMTAILRAKGVEAYSFRDGIDGLASYLESLSRRN
ncbi:hypothetical protein EYC80_001766 [Monilinia laxa]|uniref:Rhodanese domain-containing protein n=1 Tax=Monilinia laxa TaxID=61186 RepID=A0A5N6K601_MONLA|nr:hypothetical protein EYC80_001766 [Monilinia laxa]